MFDERLNTLMEQENFTFLKDILTRGFIILSPNAEKYLNDEKQLVLSNRNISEQFIIDILGHDDSYDLVNKKFDEEYFELIILFLKENGNFIAQYNIDKLAFLDLLEQSKSDLNEEQLERYYSLLEKVNFNSYVTQNEGSLYNIEIDGINYKIPFNDMINFITLSETDYNHSLLQDTYTNLPIKHFLYAINEYFAKNRLSSKYMISEEITNRLKSIKNSEIIDIEAINRLLAIDDFNFEYIEINEDLKKYILDDIPTYLSDLEKAIYIYIKLCKTLTYDDEFYAENQRGYVTIKHEDIKHVSEINLENNKVVCYEFNAIYEKLLAELGINFSTDQALINGFGGGHAKLEFRSGKFLVKADSVVSILHGDLMQAKLNQPLNGLSCINKNQQTKDEFEYTVKKVYELIANRTKKITSNKVGEVETFEEILAKYTQSTDSIKPVNLEEKMNILIDKVNKTNMTGVDSLSYVLQLRKILFTEKERADNLRISIVRDKECSDKTKESTISAIFALRTIGIEGKYKVNYFYYRPNEQLIPMTREELIARFLENSMGYINEKDPKIPGIKR